MDATTVSSSSEVNNGDASLPPVSQAEPAETRHENEVVCVPEEIPLPESVKHVDVQKELSWEKIAAEIAEDETEASETVEQEATQINAQENVGADTQQSFENEITETVIEEATETEIITEEKPADSSFSEVGDIQESVDLTNDTSIEQVVTQVEDIETEIVEADHHMEEVEHQVHQELHQVEDVEAKGDEVEPMEQVTSQDEKVETEVEEVSMLECQEMEAQPIDEPELVETSFEVEPVEEVAISEVSVEVSDTPSQEGEEHKLEDSKEEVVISELKAEEVGSVEDVEYTVVEADEVETHEIIEEHIAQTKAAASTTETVVIINPDQTQTEITIEQIDDDKSDENSQSYSEEIYVINKSNESVDDPVPEVEVKPKPKKPRGRKPISDIPLHVLGRDITKPTEGVSNGGRTMPKPRLGVKVPYRNLTSQIVSKQEIEKEIMERFKMKQEQHTASSGDLMFARKLTQRLAKKLIPSEKGDSKTQESGSSKAETIKIVKAAESEIKNNSDLIAILEGDDDDIIAVSKPKPFEKKEMSKSTEKEIALQQLRELPNTPVKNKFFKSRDEEDKKERDKEKEKDKEREKEKEKEKEKEIEKEKDKEKEKEKDKEKEKEREKEKKDTSSVKTVPKTTPAKPSSEKKSQIEAEPRLKTGMVLKTYTRKRKSTELEQPILPPKKSVVVATVKTEDGGPPTDVYITKSSRIIKKKVIWDPDEIPSKSPIRSPIKIETSAKPGKPTEKKVEQAPVKTVTKPVEKKVEQISKPVAKPVEKKIEPEKSQEKKVKKEVVAPKPAPVAFVKVVATKASPVAVAKVVGSPNKRPKRLTEVDKLLMDEGAVNMLYDVKTNDEAIQKKKSNKSMISLDKAHKELMSKTNVIKNDLQQHTGKEGQKVLRKKDVPSPPKKEGASPGLQRKKSKDSSRSSVHTPPSSPPYHAAEASRIIRRHSSSSFSSGDELTEDGAPKKKGASSSDQPPRKKTRKTSDVKPPKDVSKNNNNTVTDAKVNHIDKTPSQNKHFALTKKNKLVSIKLHNVDGKCFLTESLLKELTSSLKTLGKDDDCLVVSITSDSKEAFCDGLDYTQIVADDDNARKKKATELAGLVKEFLRCLLHFPKVLVAGIQGGCVGLGVTMLPLFDMVIASDTSTFSTPYANLGCVPEAGFLLTVPYLNSHGLASELLYSCQIIEADDAFRRGLVTKLCWPERYQEELKLMLNSLASKSKQSIVATKQQLRQHISQNAETALNSLSKVLVENWTSAECQKTLEK